MNTPFHYAHSAIGLWGEAVQDCIRQLAPVPDGANLGFVYVTDLYANRLADILTQLREQTGITQWVGSVGVGVCVSSREYMDESAIVVMLGEFPADAFQVFAPISVPDDIRRQLEDFKVHGDPAYFALVHGDGHNPDIAELIEVTAAGMASGFITGGMSSSRFSALQVANEVVQGGLSGVMFSDQVIVVTRLTQGVTPIGPRHRVTASQENILISLDGRSALEVLYEDIGEILSRDLQRAAGYIFAALSIPGSDSRDYLVRNLIGADIAEGLVAINEVVTPQAEVLFCRRDASAAQEDMLTMLQDLHANLPTRPRGGVYYSCLGRGESLFGAKSAELALIQQVLGDVPLVGFFANGEISHDRLYGYTGVLTLFV
ncbi:MAG: FIST signal transduction protein [Sulfuriferula sp.]